MLSDHEEGIGLTVGGGVGAEVVDVDTIHNLGLRPVVMDQHLDSISHVVGHTRVLQDDITSGRVHIEAVASIPRYVGMRYGHQVWRIGDMEPIVSRVLHLDVLHDWRHSPRLYGRGCIELTSIFALAS